MQSPLAPNRLADLSKSIFSAREFLSYGSLRPLPGVIKLRDDLTQAWGTGPARFIVEGDEKHNLFKPKQVDSPLQQLNLRSGDRVVFIHPHDDDSILGAATYMFDLIKAGIQTSVIQVTDGSLGFTNAQDQKLIFTNRKIAAIETYAAFGVDVAKDLHFLDFPDGSLERWRGITLRNEYGETPKLEGALAALVESLRKVKPDLVIIASDKDLHPDHQAAFREGLWSLYQACEGVWLPLGTKISMPKVFEYSVYSSLGASAAGDLWNFHPNGVEFGSIAMRSFLETQAQSISGITSFLAKPFSKDNRFYAGQWQRLKPVRTIIREDVEARVQETGVFDLVLKSLAC